MPFALIFDLFPYLRDNLNCIQVVCIEVKFSDSSTRSNGLSFQLVLIQFSKFEICDFDRQFLWDSYLLKMAQKTCHSTAKIY